MKPILWTIAAVMAFVSCSSSKKVVEGKEAFTPEMQKAISGYPDIVGFERRAIFLSKLTPDEEKEMKIEIFPGREMFVDCNRHGLQGQMLKKSFNNGNDYFLFNSNGEVFSTKMACPDETKTQKFIVGESVMTDYRSDIPLVAYTSQHFQVKYTLWKSGEKKSFKTNGNRTLATKEAMNNTKIYPDKDNYVKHVLYLPPLKNEDETNRKIEIIPGKTLKVDCNRHTMTGKIEKGEVSGFGFDYRVFNSNGNYTSTRMGCGNAKSEEKFVSGATELLPYNSALPIVVYTPFGFDVQYKIWETNGKMY